MQYSARPTYKSCFSSDIGNAGHKLNPRAPRQYQVEPRASLFEGKSKSSDLPDRADQKTTSLRELFQDAERNIVRLNESRLKALSELRAAERRISDLEARLSEAVADKAVESGSSRTESFVSAATEAIPTSGPAQLQQEKESISQWLDLKNNAIDDLTTSLDSQVTIIYGTGWQNAYIHFKLAGEGWTQIPGQKMQPGDGSFAGSKVATFAGSQSIEFVMNNGDDSWDSPNPYGSEKRNYIIDSPGTYYLKSGHLQKLH